MMIRFISSFSKAGQPTKPTPTKTTVEAVDAMNGTFASPRRNSLRSCQKQPTSTPEVGRTTHGSSEQVTRNSPKKRKEPPTEGPEPMKRSRLSRASARVAVDAMHETSVPQQMSNSNASRRVQRSNIYDPPIEDEPAQDPIVQQPKKKALRKKSTKPTESRFEGVNGIDLPHQDLIVSSSPAQATRSHDQARRVQARRPARAEGSKKLALPQGRATDPRRNNLVRAAELINEVDEVVEPKIVEDSTHVLRSRPSKGVQKVSEKQPATKDVEVPSADEPQDEPTNDESEDAGEEAEQSMMGTDDDSPSSPATVPKRRRSRSKPSVEEAAEATDGVAEPIALYDCSYAWKVVLVNAKKTVQDAKAAKSKQLKGIMEVIKSLKGSYNTIYQNKVSEDLLEQAETEITVRTRRLRDLREKVAALDPKHHNSAFVEQLYVQIIPRMSFMMKAALASRYDDTEKSLSIQSLEELVALMNIVLAFRQIGQTAKDRPDGLLNAEGEGVLVLTKNVIASVRKIRDKYSKVVKNHHREAIRLEDGRWLEAQIARETKRAAAIHQQRLQERNDSYQRKLREEKERQAIAARQQKEKLVDEAVKWKEALMTNRSSEAERLRQKFGLEYRLVSQRPEASPVFDTVVDIDDFEFDSDFETVEPRATQSRANGIQHARPRARREPTEDIPAPSSEQKWTEQQTEALVWGLRKFRGRDKYQKILEAIAVKDLLRGKNDLDLMQQALYIKQSMGKAMETSVLPTGEVLEGDWTWLRSIPG